MTDINPELEHDDGRDKPNEQAPARNIETDEDPNCLDDECVDGPEYVTCDVSIIGPDGHTVEGLAE